jgi:flagellar motor switch protein FliG
MTQGSDQRIRHVAIVLQSLDAATSRGLLAQLPPAQSKLVRQAMVNLGTIDPQERAAAFGSMQGLLGDVGPKKPVAVNHSASGAASPGSPAAELLLNRREDQFDAVDLSQDALQKLGEPNNTVPTHGILLAGSWHHIPVDVLAEILQGERPIVIATVLNQVSIDRATAIVQLLPIQVAGATLAAVPQLHLTDPAILKDIELELEKKISHHQPQQQMSNEGLSRLQAILAGMPESQKNIWTNAVSQSNPVLAKKLGWGKPVLTDSSLAIPLGARTGVRDESVADDIFEDSYVVPFPLSSSKSREERPKGSVSAMEENDKGGLSASSLTDKKQTAAPKLDGVSKFAGAPEVRVSPLQSLEELSDRDFVTVLHACQPQLVLLALSGATREFVLRVERLLPGKDVQRLRERLTKLGPIQLREVDAAQSIIAETAAKLRSIGKIKALDNVAFTAAA